MRMRRASVVEILPRQRLRQATVRWFAQLERSSPLERYGPLIPGRWRQKHPRSLRRSAASILACAGFRFREAHSNSDYSTRVIPPFRRHSLCVTDAHFDLEGELAEVREA